MPPPLDGVSADRIRQFPARSAFLVSRWGFRGRLVQDAEAAGGLAVEFNVSGQPFSAGYYNESARKQHGVELAPGQVKGPGYALYRLGAGVLGEHGYFWCDRSWAITFGEVRDLYDPSDPGQEWEFWASLRFEGPLYGQAPEDDDAGNRFYVDRIVCVRLGDASAAETVKGGVQRETGRPEVDFAVPE